MIEVAAKSRIKKKVKRHAMVSAKTKAAAIKRMQLSYPAPKYFGWACDNHETT
jgi:hypothetical protein